MVGYGKEKEESKKVLKATIPEDSIGIDTIEKDKFVVGFIARVNLEQLGEIQKARKDGNIFLKIVEQ